ncbi:MAG TPA: hypothetical protein VMW47_13310 [Verrucomicrobiae bacterium]|nr:hypothetical protein [Verrucomicrobiae bacterium]
METISRRTFLTRTSLGVAAAGAMATIPGASVLAASRKRAAAPPAGAALLAGPLDRSGPLLVSITDARSGTLSILPGEGEMSRHDPALVASLLRARA